MGQHAQSDLFQEQSRPDHVSRRIAAFFRLRFWKLMIIAAYPFLLVTTRSFEALEHTGPAGAFVADLLLPALLSGYLVLFFVLKKKNV